MKGFGFYVLFGLLLLSTNAIGNVTYTTIADGDWSSDINWSLDGLNPCGCHPPPNIKGFSVIINHYMYAVSDVEINYEGSIVVNDDGYLDIIGDNTVVSEGKLIVYGSLNVYNLYIFEAGQLNIFGEVNILGKTSNKGSVYLSGDLTIDNSEFTNYWEIDMEDGCFRIEQGSFSNQPGASVNGHGAFITDPGNLFNAQGAYFSPNISWCVYNGEWSNLPTEMDCQTAEEICLGFITLPVAWLNIQAETNSNGIRLSWQINSDIPIVEFAIERSRGTAAFEEIACVPSLQHSEGYFFVDELLLPGSYYYRISSRDESGSCEYSPIVSAFWLQQNIQPEIRLVPNPSPDGHFQLFSSYPAGTKNARLRIFSSKGRMIREEWIPPEQWEPCVTQIVDGSGVYFIRLDNGNGWNSCFRLLVLP